MKKELVVIYDDEALSKISVNGENGFKDPELDLKVLLEATVLIANAYITSNIGEFEGGVLLNGKKIDDFMKGYIDDALADYKPAFTKEVTEQ